MADSKKHPFKFLDAYERADRKIYFGREEEIEQLYNMLFQTDLVLVYGASGTGKTSLIQCGLANQFPETSWLHLFIRRGSDLNQSLLTAVREKRKKMPAGESQAEDMGWFSAYLDEEEGEKTVENSEIVSLPQNETIQAVKDLYLSAFKPIYLIFDQFEELFILGSLEEKRNFIKTVGQLIKTDLPCKIILSMREEYLAELYEFEREIPSIFHNRLRVELTNREKALMIIEKACAVGGIQLEKNADIPNRILDLVTENGRERIHFPFLQIVLVKLFNMATTKNNGQVLFDRQLLQKLENKGLGDILTDLLDEHLKLFKKEIENDENIAIAFLKILVSKLGTKKPLSRQAIFDKLQSQIFTGDLILKCIHFFTEKRILRPLSNDQFELVHDSLAKRIATRESILFNIPEPPAIPLPSDFFDPSSAYDFPESDQLASLFFGRELEILNLYNKIVYQNQKWLTLFGKAGVGKSALIRSGLPPYLTNTFLVSYFDCRQESSTLSLRGKLPPFNDGKKVILFFDHFGELLNERDFDQNIDFLKKLTEITEASNQIRIVFIIREERFTRLMDLDNQFPVLLENRYRIEPLKEEQLLSIVASIFEAWGFKRGKPRKILNKLPIKEQEFIPRQLLFRCKESFSKAGDSTPKVSDRGFTSPETFSEPNLPPKAVDQPLQDNRPISKVRTSLIYLAYANKQTAPLPSLRKEDEAIYRILIPGALKEYYLVHRDSYSTFEGIAQYLTIARDQITIFHYSGKAGRDALISENQTADDINITKLLGQCANLKLVVLNGCSTQEQVQTLLDNGIPAVLATSAPVDDDKAARFAIRFYRTLSEGETIGQAFEMAMGEVLAIDSNLEFSRSLSFGDDLSTRSIWGLFLRDEYRSILEEKLPKAALAATAASTTSNYKPNEQLIEAAWTALMDYSERIKRESQYDDGQLSQARKREAILNALPAPIAEHIKKLMVPHNTEKDPSQISEIRLHQIYTSYWVIIQMLLFVLLSELWELWWLKKGKIQINNSLSKKIQQHLFNGDELRIGSELALMDGLIEFLQMHQHSFFLPEMETIRTANNIDSPLFQSCFYMETLQVQLFQRNIDPEEIEVLCSKGEHHLAVVLSETAFLSKYSFVAVREIDVRKYRHTPTPIFRHSIVELRNLLVGMEGLTFDMQDFMDSQSILLFNDKNQTYLNLSPFIIDANAFEARSNVSKIFFFSHYRPISDEYYYKYAFNPDQQESLIIKEAEQNFEEVKLQLEAFRELLGLESI